MTPMLSQYFKTKDEYPGCVLLFRVGDFYEAYGEDAELISKDLEIVLTSKDAGEGRKVAMAGVPHFALDTYLHMLVGKGHKVAISEQVEDPKKVKGIVKREVMRVVSSGTILDPQMLDGKKNNYLASLLEQDGIIGLSLADISTGDFEATQYRIDISESISEELDRWRPSELIISPALASHASLSAYLASERIPCTVINELPDGAESEAILREHFGPSLRSGPELYQHESALRATATLLRYLRDTQKSTSLSLRFPRFFSRSEFVTIDATSKRNLELLETIMARERKGTLLWALDDTCTAMGGRLLRAWVVKPLVNHEEIERRLDAVQELMASWDATKKLRALLSKIQDVERLLSKCIFGTATGRDLLALLESANQIPSLKQLLAPFKSPLLVRLGRTDTLDGLRKLLEDSLHESPPATLREGNLIRDGYHSDLDELREIRRSAKDWIARMEERERERTGIKSLKIGFNQVFGYYIEITRTNLKMVPEDYIRKQTIANGERFFSPELKEYETKVLSADERIKNLEFEIFSGIREVAARHSQELQELSAAVATLDVLASFSVIAAEHGYCRPQIKEDRSLIITEGRHPVVERILGEPFVKNDVEFNENERMIIITGPNMSGKSTYLRQTALIVIMAQIGSFVPAQAASIGIVDRIFTRVGATDDLHLGQSTFMVEMLETSNIINNATERSLVILDEIGRGTGTFDGLSIAWAVAEFLNERTRCKALFATHFLELTMLAKAFPGIRNRRVAVKETRDEIIFLHKILPGSSDKSYGIYVAKLAGFPQEILQRAQEILEEMENEKKLHEKIPHRDEKYKQGPLQLTFFEDSPHPVIDEIRRINIMEMTPLQALNRIYRWQRSIDRFRNEGQGNPGSDSPGKTTRKERSLEKNS
ncbi:MAG: DNA mismatch repair protein MutS [Candidatus Eremiobacteraeota bacterium]|nr:DNA mismatch repair protein MutS [Candidatus Eremiobacteraeota bacterium]